MQAAELQFKKALKKPNSEAEAGNCSSRASITLTFAYKTFKWFMQMQLTNNNSNDDENNQKEWRKGKVKGAGRNILKKAKREKHHSRNK